MSALGHHRPTYDIQAALRQRLGRHGNLPGKDCNSYGWLDTVAAREAQRPLARLVVQACGRRSRFRDPIDHDVGQELVTRKDAFDIACTIAPDPKFFDDPSCESNWRIIQCVTQGLRLGCLFMTVAAFGIPPRAQLSEIRTRNLILWLYVQRASEQKTPRDVRSEERRVGH